MKFTLSWLKRHLNTDADASRIAERLTALGLEVERLEDRAVQLAPFTVGYVVEAKRHPNADRLSVCLVDTGEGVVQVVCGAPNARTGMKGVFAAAGSVIPGTGMALTASTIRGVDSNGMLCSMREMGLSDEHEGIIELPEDAPVGAPFASVMGLDDPVIDAAVTPNRPDCLGVRGISRDLAAAGLGRLKPIDAHPVPGAFDSPIRVRIEPDAAEVAACPIFVGRMIRGVRNGESPRWLKDLLLAVGLRPISALVDITNFFSLDLARPLHVFDADTLAGDIRVRLARPGEKLAALNGKTYELDGEMTAIADADGVIGLGGVIGGESTGCTEATQNVFLECAWFDPRRTAATGRKLAIESDARYRFERGVDPAAVVPSAELATRMILELCGGSASELVIAGAEPAWRRDIILRPGRLQGLGGLAVPEAETQATLERLGFAAVPEADGLRVAVPSWRLDIEGEADLVEEVLRVKGYDAIPAVSLPRATPLPEPALDERQRRVPLARRILAARGLLEAVTYSFASSKTVSLFNAKVPARIANPISAELDLLRPTVLVNLVEAAGRNLDRGQEAFGLFEVGPAYRDDTGEGQELVAAGIRCGGTGPRHWRAEPRPVDAFDAKADALALLGALGMPIDNPQISTDAPAWYHPGRSGCIRLGPAILGRFGELHPRILKGLDIAAPVAGFEVLMDAVPLPRGKAGTARPLLKPSPFQVVTRDFAFLVDAEIPAEKLIRAAKGADKTLIRSVALFDVYTGKGVPEGKKSLAIAVTLQAQDRTLTDAEIEAAARKIVQQVTKTTGASLRG
ncbi:MAG TPA: phenylalanine--tRNA ligase subunit beta [Alphaproteobacteria bacterium]|nr:phenylalanine--tRNA ligase subunit beta [Alphaproteobacteria bacterium]